MLADAGRLQIPLPIAPEAIAGIKAAHDALEKQAIQMAAVGDPTAPTAAAFAQTAGALHRLVVDAFLKIEQIVQEGRKPWSCEETRTLITQLDQTLLYRWTQFNRWAIAIGVGMALMFGLVCAAGGWFARGDVPALAGVHARAEKCQDQANGGRLCWIPVWERLPPK